MEQRELEIRAFIKLIIDNNRIGVISQLLKQKYLTTPVNISNTELENMLYNLYVNNLGAFYTIVKNAGWDVSNTNYTNSTATRNLLAPTIGKEQLSVFARLDPEEEQTQNAAIMRNWFETATDLLLGGSSETGTTVTVTEQPAAGSGVTKVAIIAIVAVAILAVIWLVATGKLKM